MLYIKISLLRNFRNILLNHSGNHIKIILNLEAQNKTQVLRIFNSKMNTKKYANRSVF